MFMEALVYGNIDKTVSTFYIYKHKLNILLNYYFILENNRNYTIIGKTIFGSKRIPQIIATSNGQVERSTT